MNRRVSMLASIAALQHPCWMVLTGTDEESAAHYRDRDAAAAATRGDITAVLAERPGPCWAATTMCGYVYDENDSWAHHFDDPDALRATVLGAGWKAGDHGQLTCSDPDCQQNGPCAGLPPLPPDHDPLPGQATLW